jgi:hypothetical protein
MPTPITIPGITVTPGSAAGVGATTALLAATVDGRVGRLLFTAGTAPTAGQLAVVSLSGLAGSLSRATTIAPGADPNTLICGSLADPDVRPIAWVLHPVPAVAAVAVLQVVPTLDVNARMAGFEVWSRVAVPAGAQHTFCWAVS